MNNNLLFQDEFLQTNEEVSLLNSFTDRSNQIRLLEQDLSMLQSISQEIDIELGKQTEQLSQVEENIVTSSLVIKNSEEILKSTVLSRKKLLGLVTTGTIITSIWMPVVHIAIFGKVIVTVVIGTGYFLF
jgi:hypothetical protein